MRCIHDRSPAAHGATHRRANAAPLACLIAAATLALTAGCSRKAAVEREDQEAEARSPERPKVAVVRPQRKTVSRPISRPGYNIEAYQSTALYPKISGYVGKWHLSRRGKPFDIGDRVRRNEVLAELLVPEMEVEVEQKQALVAQAEAEVKQARAAVLRSEADRDWRKAQYDRLSRVGRSGVLDRENVEEARFALEAARAAVAKAQADVAVARARLPVARKARDYAQTLLRYTKIVAPFDGVITRRRLNEGDFVQPAAGMKGEPLFVVDQVDPVRVFVNVPEAEAGWIRDRDEATVRSRRYPGRPFKGTVTRTSGSLDPATRTLRTEIDLPNPEGELLSGMYVDVTITPRRPNAWALPESAVVVTDEGAWCYRLEGGKAVRTPLQVGLSGGGVVQVLKKQVKASPRGMEAWEEISGQEQVIAGGLADLKDGQAVEAEKK
jgi:RND family efflux transporter MFP subunit